MSTVTLGPKETLGNCIAFSPRDWSAHHRDAWMYGIIIGWCDESLTHLQKTHGWSDSDVQRLKELHKAFKDLS